MDRTVGTVLVEALLMEETIVVCFRVAHGELAVGEFHENVEHLLLASRRHVADFHTLRAVGIWTFGSDADYAVLIK